MSPGGGAALGVMPPLTQLPLLLNTAVGFRPRPGNCLCYESSDSVDCGSGGPVRVPRDAWPLDASGNKMTEVRPGSFAGLWSLRILLMSNNSVHTLQPQSLSSLPFLERLDLNFNRLCVVETVTVMVAVIWTIIKAECSSSSNNNNNKQSESDAESRTMTNSIYSHRFWD